MKYILILGCLLLTSCISSRVYKDSLNGIYRVPVRVVQTTNGGSILEHLEKKECRYSTHKRLVEHGVYDVKIKIPQTNSKDSIIVVDLIHYQRRKSKTML